MTPSRRALIVVAVLIGLGLGLPWGDAVATASAQTISVTSANPPSGEQGTVNLNVLIKGKGFKNGAKAKFYKTGTTDPAGIDVKSTQYVSSTQLLANIDIADTAALALFDIQVQNTDGRTGKGTELFSVTAKKVPPPPPNPAIVFEAQTTWGRTDLWVMNADGSNQTLILPARTDGYHGNHTPKWSPDGERIAFGRTGNFISLINKDGSGLCNVAQMNVTPDEDIGWGTPQWMPDGRLILYADDNLEPGDSTHLHVVEARCDGNPPVDVVLDPAYAEVHWPALSPDGRRFAAEAIDHTGKRHVVVFDLIQADEGWTAANPVDLTETGPLAGEGDMRDPAWAHTSDRIAVEVTFPDTTPDIWVIDVTTKDAQNLTQTPTTGEGHPSWSPDDLQITYEGSNGIYVVDANGQNVKRLAGQISSKIPLAPDWRPNWQPIQ